MTGHKRMLSVAEFCHQYGIGKTMAYAEMSAGRLPFVKRGRRRLIPVDGAEAWAAPTPQSSSSSASAPAANRGSA
jgi:excisionase family DNA binding protein